MVCPNLNVGGYGTRARCIRAHQDILSSLTTEDCRVVITKAAHLARQHVAVILANRQTLKEKPRRAVRACIFDESAYGGQQKQGAGSGILKV